MISKIPYKLFRASRAFSTAIKSVPGNKAPVREETVAGRYAGVVFKIASANEKLDVINQDMEFLAQMLNEVGKTDLRARRSETLSATPPIPRLSLKECSISWDRTLTLLRRASSRT